MSRPPSSSETKTVKIPPDLIRAFKRAQLDAEERGEPFPPTLSAGMAEALYQFLERRAPQALTAHPGRPRTTPRKPPAE